MPYGAPLAFGGPGQVRAWHWRTQKGDKDPSHQVPLLISRLAVLPPFLAELRQEAVVSEEPILLAVFCRLSTRVCSQCLSLWVAAYFSWSEGAYGQGWPRARSLLPVLWQWLWKLHRFSWLKLSAGPWHCDLLCNRVAKHLLLASWVSGAWECVRRGCVLT